MWDAMHHAYDALGVNDTRNLPGPAVENNIAPPWETYVQRLFAQRSAV
ncbi:hypothetical protein [Sphaerisporangium sp. TRM90804]|nr:hypothetical protein [Sphaerisporangium sp. TRM90804]MDH2424752.1 hypothetical protein [Sphaerisporangium sp. TRM90804]